FLEQALSFFDIRSFQSYHQWHREMYRFRSVNNPLRDYVALHDAAKNVHQNGLHVFVRDQDFESLRHLLLRGAAADIEEVCGITAVKFDDVHRCHGQSSAVNETGDISIQADVIESVSRRFDLARIFLRDIAHGCDFRMPSQGVVIEIKFRIERQHRPCGSNDQRIDFYHRAIEPNEGAVQSVE